MGSVNVAAVPICVGDQHFDPIALLHFGATHLDILGNAKRWGFATEKRRGKFLTAGRITAGSETIRWRRSG